MWKEWKRGNWIMHRSSSQSWHTIELLIHTPLAQPNQQDQIWYWTMKCRTILMMMEYGHTVRCVVQCHWKYYVITKTIQWSCHACQKELDYTRTQMYICKQLVLINQRVLMVWVVFNRTPELFDYCLQFMSTHYTHSTTCVLYAWYWVWSCKWYIPRDARS